MCVDTSRNLRSPQIAVDSQRSTPPRNSTATAPFSPATDDPHAAPPSSAQTPTSCRLAAHSGYTAASLQETQRSSWTALKGRSFSCAEWRFLFCHSERTLVREESAFPTLRQCF